MEEQKNNGKTVSLNENQDAGQEKKQLTYEQLNEVAVKLYNENSLLKQENSGLKNLAQTINRLDYLLKIVEIGEKAFHGDFLIKCAEEIEEIMTPPTESEEKKEGN